MYPLLALSLGSVAVSLERSLFWLAVHRASHRRWLERLSEAVRRGDSDRVRSQLKKGGRLYGGVARALAAARGGGGSPEGAEIEILIRERVEGVRPRIERFATVMSTIITAAPMLGILGTVTGIIRSFRLLGDRQIEDPSMVAGGIAEALLTTAFGLIVALITLFPYMVFRGQAERCFNRLELLGAVMSHWWSRSEAGSTCD